MGTNKVTKSNGKIRKVSTKKAASYNDHVNSVNINPTEEEIREKANAIYNQRVERGDHGSDLSDSGLKLKPH